MNVVSKESLPILAQEAEFVAALREFQVVIVRADTGSGKSTQLPQILYSSGFAQEGKIAITQPRRVAAESVARYVASQMGTELGDQVGYRVRLERQVRQTTPVVFMTDGILLRELREDPLLRQYSVIMVDEAHERTANIDLLLAMLKRLLPNRPDLRIVVASATMDAGQVADYFGKARVIEAPGQMFPVEVIYHSHNLMGLLTFAGENPYKELIQAITARVMEIHQSNRTGDILVFMPGEDEINQVIRAIQEEKPVGLRTVAAHGRMSLEDQGEIFQQYPGVRKVVVATNIAETSITIPGIVFVIDSGLIKEKHFHPEAGMESIDLVPHSRAGCDQRKGRAGRTMPGVCYRMFPEVDFDSRPEYTLPEMLRASLADIVLAIKHMSLPVEGVDFLDNPEPAAIREALTTLVSLGALQKGSYEITELGLKMAALPLDPIVARMVIQAEQYGCTQQVATIAAFLYSNRLYNRSRGEEHLADRAHAQFQDGTSDVLTYLKIWDAYQQSGANPRWCRDNFLSAKALYEIARVRWQLMQILREARVELTTTQDLSLVTKAVTSGLLHNLCAQAGLRSYSAILRRAGREVFIHPGSTLFYQRPSFFVSLSLVETTKLFARVCTTVEKAWLMELIPHLLEKSAVTVDYVNGEYQVCYKMLLEATTVGYRSETVTKEEAIKIQKRLIEALSRRTSLRLVRFHHPIQIVEGGFTREAWHTSLGIMRIYFSQDHLTVRPGEAWYVEIYQSLSGSVTPHLRYVEFEGMSAEVATRFPLHEAAGLARVREVINSPAPTVSVEEVPVARSRPTVTPFRAPSSPPREATEEDIAKLADKFKISKQRKK